MTTLSMQGDLRAHLQGRTRNALIEIDNHDAERLRFDPAEAAQYVIERASLAPVALDWTGLTRSEPRETTVQRVQFGEKYSVAAQRIDFFVPVSGSACLLGYRASTYLISGLPDVDLGSTEISFSFTAAKLNPTAVRTHVEAIREAVNKIVGWVNKDLEEWVPTLRSEVFAAAHRRKERLDAAAAFSDAFDVPLRRAHGARQIQVPVTRATVRVTEQAAGTPARPAPEPRLAEAVYEDVVRTLRAVGNSFERLPQTATKFNEEELRDVLLFILNSNFEGAAQGEVFNGAGKTDILIQHQDRNAFIGECKVWHGEKKFGEAIDQLVSYTVWRDTKAALILFIRTGNATEILAKADARLRAHASFESARQTAEADSRTDYLLHAKDDPARLIRVALLPFVLRARDEPPDT